jgi:hypothetical protein
VAGSEDIKLKSFVTTSDFAICVEFMKEAEPWMVSSGSSSVRSNFFENFILY